MKRPRSPCFAAERRFEVLRRLHESATTAPLFRRKRTLDCGLDRTPGSPPVKRPRLEGGVDDSHAFLWEIQETPKEPTFGKDSKHNKQHKNGGGAGGGPAVTAALAQSPPATSPMDAQAPPLVEPGGCDKLDLSAVLCGPPLPADAAMEMGSPPTSDEDDPAFNAFNYWKTPFPDVSVDVVME
ncbi:uncharacterized protein LOC142575944 isoform X1 [Dermacentor variabilis]|uniref:uncharacterized protein LOC142575944 isoform X1 n=1 Tax=Dermacentor variabilis TaxID=34621 RepID=UPI003F5C37E1